MIAQDKKTLYSWTAFGLSLVLLLSVTGLYLYNIIRWSNGPERGFFYRSASGIDIVGGVREEGRIAGLRPGDRILKVNGKVFSTPDERRDATFYPVGEKNVYWVERAGKQFEVSITNTRFGLRKSFFRSGFPFLAGFCYLCIGVLVFFMQPHRHSSWVFYLFGACFGLLLVFLFKSDYLKPPWLGTVNIIAFCFTPATVVHLMLSFPVKRKVVDRYPSIQYFPYAVSLLIFIAIRYSISEMLAIPRGWYRVVIVYLALSLAGFLLSCIHLWLRSPSEIVKVRSKCVLLGAFIATSIPVLDLISSAFFHVFVVPGFNYYLPFIVFFPLCVGYAIVKHNLFDIQKTVRKTFGYILITASIAALYTILVFIPAMTFGKRGFAEYPGIAVAAILIVVFIFNLFRQRMQRVVDRVFYRMEYDYQEIMEKIGKAMRTSMMLDQIVNRMMDIIFNSLFIEKGYVMLKSKDRKVYVSVLHQEPTVMIPANDLFIRKIAERKKGVTRYDMEEDPDFRENKELFGQTFNRLEATLIIPIVFEDQLFGLLVLGEKKSGKFYRREDILLLNILTNQAAVAMENTRLQQARIEALELSKKELEQLNKAKSKTLDLLSHELKTPLSVISATMVRLKRDSEPLGDPQKKEKIFNRLEANLNRLFDIQDATYKIVRSHKEVERSVIGGLPGASSRESSEWIDLYPLAQKILAAAKAKANHRELSFELKGSEKLGVRTNSVILEDAAEALMRNAIENTPDEGLIRVLLEENDGEVFFKVKDFGVGIAAENRKYLFDAFYHTQESDRYTTGKPFDFNAGGKGLSLFRIRSYAEQFGFGFFMNSKRCIFLPTDRDACPGRVSACPHCGRLEDCLTSGGSTFWLAFPAA